MAEVGVFKAENEFGALIIRDMLVQSGIPAMIHQNDSAVFGGVFTGTGQVNWGEVIVLEEHAEHALELIAGFKGTLGELTEAGPTPEEGP